MTEAVGPPRPDLVRVLVADEAPEMRALLRQSLALDPSVVVVGEAVDGTEAAALAGTMRPDVLLLAIDMPAMTGLGAIREIHLRSPGTRIVVLSTLNGAPTACQVAQAGAAASLPRGAGADALLATVHRVASAGRTGPDEVPEPPEPPGRDLLSFVTHEIGNQLTVIHGFAEMLAEGIDELPPAMRRQFSQAIVRNAVDMRELLQWLSDLRQIDEGGLRVDPQPVDLVPIVRGALDRRGPRLGARHVTIAHPDRLVAYADADRIGQIVAHLLSNVARHTPATSAVAVELAETGEGVELAVTDDGPGIPPGRVADAFRRFGRLDPAVIGAGVGLYLSREIARAHGGDLVLAGSEAGCRFVLRLPYPPRPDPVQPESASMTSPWR